VRFFNPRARLCRLLDVASRPLNILFVDDDAEFTDTAAEALRNDGHHVCCARDGASAMAFASELGPDVVLLDLRIPYGDRYNLAHALRQRIPPTTPIIVLTAVPSAGHNDDIDLIVSKPVALELFGGLVDYIHRCRGRAGGRTR
jgi:DNA-binding response OmpR family regulator